MWYPCERETIRLNKEAALMTSYAKLSRKPRQFHALTGYTLEEFHALLPAFVVSALLSRKVSPFEGQNGTRAGDRKL